MKLYMYAVILGFAVLSNSCASVAKFPVSSTVPAAEITAKKMVDKNNNYVIELVAKNLANSERLDPPKSNFSVWIITDDNVIKNIGQLNNSNGKRTTLKTLTAFNVKDVPS